MRRKSAITTLVFIFAALWSMGLVSPLEASCELRGEVCKDCLSYEGGKWTLCSKDGSGTLTWRHLVEGSTTKPPRRLERFIYEGPNNLLIEVWMRLDKWGLEGGNQLHFFYFEAPEGKAENAKGFAVHHIYPTGGAEVYRYDETLHAVSLYVPDFKRQTIFPEGSFLNSKVAEKKMQARAEARAFFTTRYPHLESFLCSAGTRVPILDLFVVKMLALIGASEVTASSDCHCAVVPLCSGICAHLCTPLETCDECKSDCLAICGCSDTTYCDGNLAKAHCTVECWNKTCYMPGAACYTPPPPPKSDPGAGGGGSLPAPPQTPEECPDIKPKPDQQFPGN